MRVRPENTSSGIQKSAKLSLWLMWQVSPNRKDTPLKTKAKTMPIAGIPQPTASAPHMKLFPRTICQQICKCSATDRMHTHITAPQPPKSRKAPEIAHVRLECISFGVISLKHCLGLAPRGTIKPSLGLSACLHACQEAGVSSHLHYAYSYGQTDA